MMELLVAHGADVNAEWHGEYPIIYSACEAIDPVALEWLAASGRFHALVALGVVLRGETPHFDYICSECSRGIARVTERFSIPVAFGVLTCDTVEQATARAGGKDGNKGWEAASAALEMADLRARLTAAD